MKLKNVTTLKSEVGGPLPQPRPQIWVCETAFIFNYVLIETYWETLALHIHNPLLTYPTPSQPLPTLAPPYFYAPSPAPQPHATSLAFFKMMCGFRLRAEYEVTLKVQYFIHSECIYTDLPAGGSTNKDLLHL